MLLLVLAAVVGATDPAGLRVLTLKEALELTRTNNLDLQMARERLEEASALSSKAWAVVLPTLSASGQWVRNIPAVEFPNPFTPPGQPAEMIVITKEQQKSAGATFQWALLNGRSIPLVQNAYASVDVAQLSYEQTEKLLLHGTTLAYFNLLTGQRQVAIRQRALQNASAHLELSQAQVELGDQPPLVALRSDVEVATAEQNLVQAKAAREVARRALAILIGWLQADGRAPEYVVERPVRKARAATGDRVALALSSRLDLKIGRLRLEMAERSKTETWTKFLPVMAGFGRYNWNEAEGFSGKKDSWQIGLSLNWDLFNGGIHYLELDERQHQINAAALHITNATQKVARQVVDAQDDVKTARSVQDAAKRRKGLARKSAHLVASQFELGAATQLEVLDANRSLADAETAESLAELSLDLAEFHLDHVMRAPPSGGGAAGLSGS